MSNPQRRIPFYARDLWIAGWVGLPLGHWFLFAQIEPFYSAIYTFLWWPFIFVLDFLVYRLRHESLLQDRPREFLLLTLWSTPIWLLFEIFNFRLQNWTYIQVPILWSDLSSWFMLPAYATVLPALFEGADLISALIGRLTQGRGLQGKPFQVRNRHIRVQMGVGVAMLVLPMIWPNLFFCLIWGFAFFFFDPLCYRRQGASLLGQLAKGHQTRFVALLLSGLMCGGLWEAWNIAARTKWLYTVPGFDDLKLFEMPLLGFLGFPPFALECYALVNFLNLFRGGRSWERRGLDNLRARGMRPRGTLWGWTATIVFSCLAYQGIFLWSVTSYSLPLDTLFGKQLNRREHVILWAEGVRYPHQFLARWGQATPESETEEKMSATLPHGFDLDLFARLRALSTLSEIKGIGLCHAVTLESVGVHTPVELAQQNPAELVERMSRKVSPNLTPSEAVTRIWIVAARAWTHQHAPDTLQPQKPSLWENFLEEDVPPENKPEETPLDLAHKAEASSRTQSPTLPQAVHQTESTSQPREMVLLPPQPTQAPRTVSTPSLDSTETLPTSEVGQTTESEETKDRLDETTRTQPTADNTDPKTTETLSAKPSEESQKAQEQTSATEPVRPAEMIPHTTATQAEKLETKDPRTTATQTGKPETKDPRTTATQTGKPETKDPRTTATQTGKPETKDIQTTATRVEKPETKDIQTTVTQVKKPETKDIQTTATRVEKPADEERKTSETQTMKPAEKAVLATGTQISKPEEKPREEMKKLDEKPKEEPRKPEEERFNSRKPEEESLNSRKPEEESLNSRKPEEKVQKQKEESSKPKEEQKGESPKPEGKQTEEVKK